MKKPLVRKISSKGQVCIPKAWLEGRGFSECATIVFTDEGILVKPIELSDNDEFDAISEIGVDPLCGALKVGDLAGFSVYRFSAKGVSYRIGYCFYEGAGMAVFSLFDTRESFIPGQSGFTCLKTERIESLATRPLVQVA